MQPGSPISVFLTLLQKEGIRTNVLARLSAAELLRLGRVCREALRLCDTYRDAAFDINRLLRRFFPDPLAFRSLQARTGTLISGSTALQFFDRTFYPSSDLDLYVHIRHRRLVGRWLISTGFHFVPGIGQDAEFELCVLKAARRGIEYSMPGVADIFTFHRLTAGVPLKVQIIVARDTPMAVILGFHSTCVMNVISYEKGYCLFPWATLEQRRSLLSFSSEGRSKRRLEGLLKYRERGFQMLHRLPAEEAFDPHLSSAFNLGWRWIDDPRSWVIRLDIHGIVLPPPPNPYSSILTHDPVAVSGFSVRYSIEDGAIMAFKIADFPTMQYRYVLEDSDLLDFLQIVFTDRHEVDKCVVTGLSLDDWTYCDEELLPLCRDYLDIVARRYLPSQV